PQRGGSNSTPSHHFVVQSHLPQESPEPLVGRWLQPRRYPPRGGRPRMGGRLHAARRGRCVDERVDDCGGPQRTTPPPPRPPPNSHRDQRLNFAAAGDGARWWGRPLIIEVEGFVEAGTPVEVCDAVGRAIEDAIFDAVPKARVV